MKFIISTLFVISFFTSCNQKESSSVIRKNMSLSDIEEIMANEKGEFILENRTGGTWNPYGVDKNGNPYIPENWDWKVYCIYRVSSYSSHHVCDAIFFEMIKKPDSKDYKMREFLFIQNADWPYLPGPGRNTNTVPKIKKISQFDLNKLN